VGRSEKLLKVLALGKEGLVFDGWTFYLYLASLLEIRMKKLKREVCLTSQIGIRF
jgi:hypothetical protein